MGHHKEAIVPLAFTGWEFQVLLFAHYIMLTILAGHALFGLVRVWVSKPPYVHKNVEGYYTLQLTPHSSTRRYKAKIIVLLAIFAVMATGALVAMLAGVRAGHAWATGFGLMPGMVCVVLHGLTMCAIFAAAGIRGYKGANRSGTATGEGMQSHPIFAALATYLQQQRDLGGSSRRFDPAPVQDQSGEYPVCLLVLPVGDHVAVRLNDGVPVWFRLPLDKGPHTFYADTSAEPALDEEAYVMLRRNGLL